VARESTQLNEVHFEAEHPIEKRNEPYVKRDIIQTISDEPT